MNATAWTVVGIRATILIAIGASFQSLRMGNEKLRDRIEAQGRETAEQLAQPGAVAG